MSVEGYLSGGKSELRMPKGPDSLGIRYHGEVLSGGKSVEQRLADDAVSRTTGAREHFSSVAKYDAVLRAHCRF